MNDSKLKSLVTEAVTLDREVAALTEKLKAIKDRIVAEADLRKDEAMPTDGGGASLVLEGVDGCICRVTTAGPTLKATIKPDSKEFPKIRALCSEAPDTKLAFDVLFRIFAVYKPVEDFRERAVDVLGQKHAAKLVKLCETTGKTTVSFETKEGV